MASNIEILLVEDTPSDIRLTQEALKRSDLQYTMAVSNDGVEAMEYLNEIKSNKDKRLPDIILLDLNMPRKNGHEVLAEIKEDPELRKIPVVLLTVSQRDEDVMEALKLKMNYYVAKPVTAQKLSVLIRSIHELAKELGEDYSHSAEETHVRLVLAGNPHTAPALLEKLASDSNQRVRQRVAENPETPQEILLKLAADDHVEVRLAVTENPKTPATLLEQLAKDPSEDVRLGIAGNPRIPSKILSMLAEDENMFVASSANKTLSDISHRA
jgi:CheY-like chemotaxis protein